MATSSIVAGNDFIFAPSASAYAQVGSEKILIPDAVITWTSSNPAVGTIASTTGAFHAVYVGNTYITAQIAASSLTGGINISRSMTTLVTAPSPPVRSNGSPVGTLAAGTTAATISLETDKSATCRYATTTGALYIEMFNTFTAAGTISSAAVSGLQSGQTYNYYVKCRDAYGALNADDYPITFSIATSATPVPVRSSGYPVAAQFSAGQSQINLSLITDIPATCKHSAAAGTAYDAMPYVFSTTGATSHSAMVGGLQDGLSYNYYVKCKSAAGSANSDDLTLSFSIASGPLVTITPIPTPTPISGKAGDIDNDNAVNILDFNLLMVNWGVNPANKNADLNNDNAVDIFDFNLLMVNWNS